MSIRLPRRRFLALGLGACGALALGGGVARSAFEALRGQYRFAGESMGSPYHVAFVAPIGDAGLHAAARDAVDRALDAVDRRMSTFRADSELSRLNRHGEASFALSPELCAVLGHAERVSRATTGAFDVTAGPLVNAWGFGPARTPRIPSRDELQALRGQVGFAALGLDARAGTVRKGHRAMFVDLSGIAKGHGVDRAGEALERLGIADYVVELGGELRARGRNAQGAPWRVAIEEPQGGPPVPRSVVPLEDLAMATSGDYRIYFERGGRRYCHEIDPVSAEPVRHALTSVTVVAKDCASADAMATALMVLGPERGHALAERTGLAASFIARGAHGTFDERSTRAFAALRPVRT